MEEPRETEVYEISLCQLRVSCLKTMYHALATQGESVFEKTFREKEFKRSLRDRCISKFS